MRVDDGAQKCAGCTCHAQPDITHRHHTHTRKKECEEGKDRVCDMSTVQKGMRRSPLNDLVFFVFCLVMHASSFSQNSLPLFVRGDPH